jgi:hypothetical protein
LTGASIRIDSREENSSRKLSGTAKVSSRTDAEIGVDSLRFALSNESGCVAEAGATELMGRTGPFYQDKKDIKETLQNNVTQIGKHAE